MTQAARNLVCSCALSLSLLPLVVSSLWGGSQNQYQVQVDKGVHVPMRDGVQLATDVYRPADKDGPVAGRFPAILTRTPYGKDGNKEVGQYFAARGYVFVAQDTRGRYDSPGAWHWLTDDGPDGCGHRRVDRRSSRGPTAR